MEKKLYPADISMTMSAARSLRAVVVWAVFSLVTSGWASAQRYTFRQYGSADGLSNLSVNCLLQDRTGYIWAGTDNGLFRYDGNRFTGYGHTEGLPNSEILSLAESPDGVLWVATQGGVALRVGHKFRVIPATYNKPFQTVAFDSHGRVYLKGLDEIIRGDPEGSGRYQFRSLAQGAMTALGVRDEKVWFARDGDLWQIRKDKSERVGSTAGLPKNEWSAIAEDTAGNLWVRSASLLYELPRGESRFVDRSDGIPHVSRARLYPDVHGRMFVSSDSGVILFDGLDRTYLDPKHGLPADSVAPILLDRQETLWLGMFGGGVVRRLGHGDWLSWKKEDGLLHNSVWSIFRGSEGRLWVGTSAGLNLFDATGKPIRSWTSRNGLAGDWVRSIIESPNGEVLVGTYPGGVSRFTSDGALLQTYNGGMEMNQVISMAIDHQSRLWVIGPAEGCLRSEPLVGKAKLSFERVSVPNLPEGTVYRNILIDRTGEVWLTTSNGLARFDGNRWQIYGESSGLRSADISAMAQGRDELWLGYRDALGIARLQLHGDSAEITSFTKQDGLSSDLIYALAVDSKDHLWASTDNGADVFDGRQWIHFGREDGLIWDDGNDLALSIDRDDNVWIGTSGGLSLHSPMPYPVPSTAPPVVLTSIEGATEDFHTDDRPVLPYTQDTLSIQFSALNYASETSTRFRYRLLGSTAKWNETRERSVHFEQLPAGRYTFEVIAAGPDSVWSTTPARFAFVVNPPWWESWWFVTLCLLSAGCLTVAIWRGRVRALVAQQEKLKQQVAAQTAELRESHRQLQEMAYCDTLTSLPNRRMFAEQFRARLAQANRQGTSFALLLVDLDHFKRINDTFGHDAGDAVLFETAARLRVAVRESDCVARLGGDEFAILLITANHEVAIETICRRIIDSVSEGIPFNDIDLHTGCSIGISMFPHDGDSQEKLYKSADLALYESKRNSRNGFCWYRPEAGLPSAESNNRDCESQAGLTR